MRQGTRTKTRKTVGLNGVFIRPPEHLGWSKAQWGDALAAIAAADMDAVIVQWCSASGRALYRSDLNDPMPGMGTDDILEAVFAGAEESGLSVFLGLDAARPLMDIHYGPVEAAARRAAASLMDILTRSGFSDSLSGIYLPQEWSAPPTPAEAEAMEKTATFCRMACPHLVVCTTAPPPRLPVAGHGWELFDTDPQAKAAQVDLLADWAEAWGEVVRRAQLDALLVRDDVGSLRCTPEAADDAYEMMEFELADTDCELWAQVGLYEVARRRAGGDPARLPSAGIGRLRSQLQTAARHCDALFGFSFEYIDPAAGGARAKLYEAYRKHAGATKRRVTVKERRTPRPADTPDPLLDKAMAVERIIEERHLLEGQIMTVVDYRYDLDDRRNQWQEDADWLTGLYTGAECLRYAATGDADAKTRARRSFEALCMLSTISGVPGVVARSYRRSFTGGLGTGRKRWIKKRGEDIWWGGDISRDQLSGHFFGLATYYDLVADDSERKLIRQLVLDIAGSLLDHRMQAVDWDGEYTIHGNFWVAPFQALATLKLAHHITGENRFQEAYAEFINPHFFLGHSIIQASAILDPFFQHYQWDSPAYHLLQYETDPDVLRHLLRALDLVYEDVKDLGNVYLYFVYQTYRPESDAARRGEIELLEFTPGNLYVPNWRREIGKYVAEHGEELPPQLRDTLSYCLNPDEQSQDFVASFIPMRLRPPMEFNWQYYVGIQTRGRAGGRPHGPYVGYAGIDYLLAYWMGRYHGFLR